VRKLGLISSAARIREIVYQHAKARFIANVKISQRIEHMYYIFSYLNTLIVFFIVFFVLNPVFEGEWQPFESLSELLTHNLSTVFMMIYFIAVPGVGVLKKTDAITVLIYPFIYFFIHTFVGLNFNFKDGNPAFNYGFINPTNYSENFIVFIILFVSLVAIFGALGFVLIQLKNKITAK
jgi:hypothetical protein